MFITSSKAKSHHQGWCFCRVVSYLNVKSLPWGTGELDVPAAFCNLDETIDHIIQKIYTETKLPKLGSKMLFKRLLLKVTKGTVFSFNNRLYKQVNGCGMGNPLSPVLANISCPN